MGQLMRVLGAPEVSAASGGCSEPERAGQRRRAMRAHVMREVSATRRNRMSPWKCTTKRQDVCPAFFVSMEFERLGLHGAADAGPGCPGGERRQWRMQRTGAGWAAAQSDASACYARSQRDTPQPDESLEVHHKKAGRLSCLFCCASPYGGGFTVRAAGAPAQLAGPLRLNNMPPAYCS